MLINILITVLIGALIGWLAGVIMNMKQGFWMNVLLGIVGSAVGRLLAGLIGIHANRVSIGGILISVVGACLVIWLARKIASGK
ncbi:MAG: GlsB/YeaQ/YmgE family stress response membrane protein [Firmicutes bacterium]|nr:GlsB/YeaQ/YmgE family stress response membrane protein [Lachnospiraceae bacterium]MBQ7059114.1 GlsB/YeaQ/YmgE family stress response membrane protein [Bacillota bacterium]